MVPEVVGRRFDFGLALMPLSDGISVRLYHTKDRLDSSWVKDFLLAYGTLLRAIAINPRKPLEMVLGEIPALSRKPTS
jgi:hypothetical protein